MHGLFRSVALGALLSCFIGQLGARPFDLDRTFGNGSGDVLVNTGAVMMSGVTLAMPDESVVFGGACGNTTSGTICVAKITRSGVLDVSFGVGGWVRLDAEPDGNGITYHEQVSMALDSSNRIVVASMCKVSFCVRRLSANGVIDTTFGTNGLVGPLRLGADYATIGSTPKARIALLSDGKILLTSGCLEVCFVRLQPNGQVDTTFAPYGFIMSSINLLTSSLNVLQTGDFIVSGTCQEQVGNNLVYRQCAARFLANGQLDLAFGSRGIVVGPPNDFGFGFDLFVDSTGRLYVIGSCGLGAGGTGCILRYSSMGVLDVNFGSNGVLAPSTVNGGLIRPSPSAAGKWIVLGACKDQPSVQLCMIRINDNGSIDTLFAPSGFVHLQSEMRLDGVAGFFFDKSGKLVIGGQFENKNFAAARVHLHQDYFDLDGDNETTVSSDAVLYLRHLLGFHDTALTSGALGTYADRTSATDIATYLSTPNATYPNCSASIVGAPGGPHAMLDGIVLLRAMMGLTGDAVTNGIAFPPGTTRTSWVDIKAHLNGNCGMALN